MSQQYFEVGEEVGLVSKSVPQLNGDYVTSHYLGFLDEFYICPKLGIEIERNDSKPSGEPIYYLHELNGKTITGEVMKPRCVLQSSLRKKYPKGESFDTLMETLNQGVTA